MTTTEAVYEFVCSFRAAHEVSPTVREVASGVGISSTSVVAYHLEKLVDDGKLRRSLPGRSTRSLVPVEVRRA